MHVYEMAEIRFRNSCIKTLLVLVFIFQNIKYVKTIVLFIK